MIKINCNKQDQDQLLKMAFSHPHPHVQRKLLAVHMRSQGFINEQICKALGIQSETTLISYCHEYVDGGIDALCTIKFNRPKSKLQPYEKDLKLHFKENPPRSVAEAMEAIKKLTGIGRKKSFVQKYLHQLGLRFLKTGGVPAKADLAKQEAYKKNSWSLA
jgi:transposase